MTLSRTLSPPAEAEVARRRLGDPRARANVRWLSALLDLPPRSVQQTLKEAGAFVSVDREIHDRLRTGGRSNYAQFRAPLELYTIVRTLRPEHVIETGVSSGVSSAHLLLALRRNRRGTLHSIDFPTRQGGARLGPSESPVSLPPGRSTGWAIPPSLRRGWDLRIGPSQRVLPELVEELPSIGLFLHDSLHTSAHLTFELETVRPKLIADAVVLADNTTWTGQAFPRFARRVGSRMHRRGRGDLVGLRLDPGRVLAPSPP